MKGPGDFLPDDEDDRVDTRTEELVEEWQKNPLKLQEASERVAEDGAMDFAPMINALADLRGMDVEKLIGSDVLAHLLRLAVICDDARDVELKSLAEEQALKESEGWPAWKGTASLTQHHANLARARGEKGNADH